MPSVHIDKHPTRIEDSPRKTDTRLPKPAYRLLCTRRTEVAYTIFFQQRGTSGTGSTTASVPCGLRERVLGFRGILGACARGRCLMPELDVRGVAGDVHRRIPGNLTCWIGDACFEEVG